MKRPRVPGMRRPGLELVPATPEPELVFPAGTNFELSPLVDDAGNLRGYRLVLASPAGLRARVDFGRLEWADFAAKTAQVRELAMDASVAPRGA